MDKQTFQFGARLRLSVLVFGMILVFGMLVAAAWLVVRSTKKTADPTNRPSRPKNKHQPSNLILSQYGRSLRPVVLVRQQSENPNRFAILARRGDFSVHGRIAKISEYKGVIDKVSGFYVPLLGSGCINKYDAYLDGYKAPDVSLFVKDITEKDAAALHIGELITVKCNGLRVVTGSLVFDDCNRTGIQK